MNQKEKTKKKHSQLLIISPVSLIILGKRFKIKREKCSEDLKKNQIKLVITSDTISIISHNSQKAKGFIRLLLRWLRDTFIRNSEHLDVDDFINEYELVNFVFIVLNDLIRKVHFTYTVEYFSENYMIGNFYLNVGAYVIDIFLSN